MIIRFLLSPWIFYFLTIAGLILATILVIKGKKRLITAKIMEDRTASTDFVYDLICAEFPSACVLKDAPVSCASTDKVQITKSLDMLYISRGGVVIISVVNGEGAFDNPKTGPWRHRYLGSGDKPVTATIPNPFDATIPAANIIEGLLAGEKIFLDVQKIAVFSGTKVGMTTHYPEAINISSLLLYLREFDQRTVMNGPQFRLASEVLTAFAQFNQHKAMTSRKYNIPEQELPEVENEEAEILEAAIPADENSAPVAVTVDEESYEVLDFSQMMSISDSPSQSETVELLREVQGEIEKDEVEEIIIDEAEE